MCGRVARFSIPSTASRSGTCSCCTRLAAGPRLVTEQIVYVGVGPTEEGQSSPLDCGLRGVEGDRVDCAARGGQVHLVPRLFLTCERTHEPSAVTARAMAENARDPVMPSAVAISPGTTACKWRR